MDKIAVKHDLCERALGFPALQEMLNAARPLVLPRRSHSSASLHLARSIIGQQISVKAACSIWSKAQVIISAPASSISDFSSLEHGLRECGVSKFKIKAIVEVFKFFELNPQIETRLSRMSHTERSKILCEIWGVGQWTSDMLSIFYFREKDIWPLSDAGLHKALKLLVGCQGQTEMDAIGQNFLSLRSYLSLYLWNYLDDEPNKKPM